MVFLACQRFGGSHMRRFSIIAVFATIALFLTISPTGAGIQWCPRDPIVALNGQEVQIWVSIPNEYQSAVTGPVDVEIWTPRGVEQEVLFTDDGFNGYGETVSFKERDSLSGDAMGVEVRIKIPYDLKAVEDGDLAVLVTVILPDGSVVELEEDFGKATVSFTIPYQP
jgi:hypothetical protein